MPGRKAGPGHGARVSSARRGSGCPCRCPLPVLSLGTGTAPGTPGKELGGRSAQPQGSIPWKSGSQQDRRRGLQPGAVFIASGRWAVLLRLECPVIYQSLSVQRSLLGAGRESPCCLPASSFPAFAAALLSPSITCFFPYHAMAGKKPFICVRREMGWEGVKPR